MTSTPTPAGFSHHFADARGLRMHYVEGGVPSGTAPATLLLVGGWPQTWYVWRKVMPRLAGAGRVIAIDMPGQGDSDPAPAHDMRTISDHVAAFLHTLAIDRVHYVGHDLGTWLGYRFASDHPARVITLTLTDSAIPGVSPPATDVRRAWHFGFNQIADLPEQLVAGRERLLIAWRAKNVSIVQDAQTEADIDEYARAYSRSGAMTQGFSFYRALAQTTAQNQASAATPLPMPVLAIGGVGGVGSNLYDSMRKLARTVHGGVYQGCGHHVPEEKPAELARDILDHLQRRTPP